jgi:hypothetical protein
MAVLATTLSCLTLQIIFQITRGDFVPIHQCTRSDITDNLEFNGMGLCLRTLHIPRYTRA